MSENAKYFDIQNNGYAGVDFNQEDLTAEDLHKACELLDEHQSDGILATFITDSIDTMAKRVANFVKLRAADPLAQRIMAGIHIEGPFLSPVEGYRGAHPVDAIHPANVDEMKQLLDAGDGLVRLVTLAPENDPGMETTRYLAKQGIAVAAGHCNASFDDLNAAADAGLSLYTHLGNGCPMQMHRHENIVQRVLSLSDRIRPCFIADGAHIAFYALKNYIKLVGVDRAVVVTDAMSAAGLGPGRYKISRWDLLIGEDMVAWAPDRSHLVGAAITMPQTAINLKEKLGLSDADIDKLLRQNPRAAVNM